MALGIYEHYKGNKYEVIGVAKHSETLEEVVIYRALYGEGHTWVRPITMFFEDIDVGGKRIPRFRHIDTR